MKQIIYTPAATLAMFPATITVMTPVLGGHVRIGTTEEEESRLRAEYEHMVGCPLIFDPPTMCQVGETETGEPVYLGTIQC